MSESSLTVGVLVYIIIFSSDCSGVVEHVMCPIRFSILSLWLCTCLTVWASARTCINAFVSDSVRWRQRINLLILFCSHPAASFNLSHSLSPSFSPIHTLCHLCFIHLLHFQSQYLVLVFSLCSNLSLEFFTVVLSVFLSFSHRHNREVLTKYDLSTFAYYWCANKAICSKKQFNDAFPFFTENSNSWMITPSHFSRRL